MAKILKLLIYLKKIDNTLKILNKLVNLQHYQDSGRGAVR